MFEVPMSRFLATSNLQVQVKLTSSQATLRDDLK